MDSKRAVIFVNGELKCPGMVNHMLRPDDFLVAVDGGLHHLETLGLLPHYVVGDLDSVTALQLKRLEKADIPVQRFPTDKDETDLELALNLILKKGFMTIVVVAALGGRTDQMLGNLAVLNRTDLNGCDIRLDDGIEEVFLVRGETEICGVVGDLVSLIPLGAPAQGVTTRGLKYPLSNETLWPDRARGISNRLIEPRAAVGVESGQLLCIHVRGEAPNCPSGEE